MLYFLRPSFEVDKEGRILNYVKVGENYH